MQTPRGGEDSRISGGTIAALGLGAGAIGGTIAGVKKHDSLKEEAGNELSNRLDRIDKRYQSEYDSARAKYVGKEDKLQREISANRQKLIEAKRKGNGGWFDSMNRLTRTHRDEQLRNEVQYARQAYKETEEGLRQSRRLRNDLAYGKFDQRIRSAKTPAIKHGLKYGALIAAPVVALGIGKHYYDKDKQK